MEGGRFWKTVPIGFAMLQSKVFCRFGKTIFQYYNRLYIQSRPCLCKIVRILKIITLHPYLTYMTVIKYLLQNFYGVDFFRIFWVWIKRVSFGFDLLPNFVRLYFFINHARVVYLPLFFVTYTSCYVSHLSATQLQQSW